MDIEITQKEFSQSATETHFQQSEFWAEFKTMHGWNAIRLGAKTSPALSGGSGSFENFYVMTRGFARAFSIAYVPMFPVFLSEDDGFKNEKREENFALLLEELANKIKPYLPKNTICVRFDPAMDFFSPEARDAFVRSVEAFAKKRGCPLKKTAVDIQPPDTTLINLERTPEEILASMKSKWRYNINLAKKRGIKIERFPNFLTMYEKPHEKSAENTQNIVNSYEKARDFDSESKSTNTARGDEEVDKALDKAIDEFYELYKITSARDGIAIHSKNYYASLAKKSLSECSAGKPSPRVSVYIARHESDLLGAIVTLFSKGEGVYLYGASSNTKRNLMPNFLLQWTAMCDAKEAGAKVYDLYGMPPTDDPAHPMHGLYLFKTGFGGTNVHRVGTFDIPLKKIYYLCAAIEKARAWWHKGFLKKIRGR